MPPETVLDQLRALEERLTLLELNRLNFPLDPVSESVLKKEVQKTLDNIGVLKGGQTKYNTGVGFFLGNEGGKYKFSLGDSSANYITWDGTTLSVVGGVNVSSLDIPDAVTANSFHVNSAGDAWWGAAAIGDALAKVLKTGVATFTDITATGTINATGGYLGAGTALITESTGLNAGITGHVRGGQTDYNTGTGFFLGYSGAAYKFSVGNATTDYLLWDGTTLDITAQRLTRFFTAGENVTAGDCLVLSNGGSFELASNTTGSNANTITTTAWTSQSFTTSANAITIEKVTIGFQNATTTGNENLRVSIRANSGGQPTGADLGSKDVTASVANTGTTWVTFTFDTPVAVSASTIYHIIIRESSEIGDANTGVIRNNNGSTGANTSANSGSTWSASNGPLYYKVYEIATIVGRIYKADADTADVARNDFIGFCKTTTAAAGSCPVVVAGVATGLSGLSIGSKYYASNTAGGVATSAGSVSIKVGRAVSATEMLINNIW